VCVWGWEKIYRRDRCGVKVLAKYHVVACLEIHAVALGVYVILLQRLARA
jgi:hypothetical protein